MEAFEYYLGNYDWPKRSKPSSSTVEEIERRVKFDLPADYRSYIQNYSGFEATIGPEYVQLWDLDELIEYNEGYEIFEYLPDTLVIGSNGGGEFIAIELVEKKEYRIVLSPFIGLDPKVHIEIGSSFTDFLVRLENGREWFE